MGLADITRVIADGNNYVGSFHCFFFKMIDPSFAVFSTAVVFQRMYMQYKWFSCYCLEMHSGNKCHPVMRVNNVKFFSKTETYGKFAKFNNLFNDISTIQFINGKMIRVSCNINAILCKKM